MSIKFFGDELRSLLREHTLATRPDLLRSPLHQTLLYPDWLGCGYKRDIELPSGIFLTFHQYRLRQTLVNICEEEHSDCFEFVFSLTTQYLLNDDQTLGDRQAYLVTPKDARWQESSDIDYLSVDVHLDRALLLNIFGSYAASIPSSMAHILTQAEVGRVTDIQTIPVTPAIALVIQQMLACPYQGVTQALYLEAKSLELIALFVEAVTQTESVPVSLSRDECDRLHHAQAILRNNLQTPPSLVELARQVGLNDRKLKEGFRQVFKTTVFGYLTQQRLEKARQLLSQQYSVAAVANAVGYASPTAFSGAFRRQFGTTPKGYQLGQRARA